MTDPQIEPSDLVDAYSDELFRYCWFLLRSREAAEIAVRDALVVAVAHGGQLLDPDRLRPWLYALARTECRRHRPVPPGAADEPPARPSQPDADNRVVAWNAVMCMAWLSSETLELLTRHQMPVADIALVTGMTAPEVEVVLASAREELGWSLAAHLVVRRTGFDCAGLTAALGGWAGTMTAAARARVLAHAVNCEICERHLPRGVSAARVFGLLPMPDPGPGSRDVLLTRLTDERHAGDRTLVAGRAEQSAALAALAAGAPSGDLTLALPPIPPPPTRRRRRGAVATRVVALSGGKLLAGIAAAGVTAAAAATIVLTGFPSSSGHSPTASRTASGAPSAVPGGSQSAPSHIGAIGAAPVSHAPGSSSPPLLVAEIPSGPPSVHDGQPLYLSASAQPSAPPISVPPPAAPARSAPARSAPAPAAAPPSSKPSSPAPIWSPPPTSTPTGGSSPPAQGHHHRHRHGTSSGRPPAGGTGGGSPPPAGGSSSDGGSSGSGSSSGSHSGGSGRSGGRSTGSRSASGGWSGGGGGSAGDSRHGAAQQ
jgi:DNA-directed RNA polymerase specialized sigma24 family protein